MTVIWDLIFSVKEDQFCGIRRRLFRLSGHITASCLHPHLTTPLRPGDLRGLDTIKKSGKNIIVLLLSHLVN